MSTNPQDVQTPGDPVPDEPGEIGWPANADQPLDPSIPEPGSGGVGPHDPGNTASPAEIPAEAAAPEPAPEQETPAAAPEPSDAPGTLTT